MSLLTIERSSSSDNLSQLSGCDTDDDQIDADTEDIFSRPRSRTSSFEGFFASKGAAYAIPDGDFARKATLKGGELQSHLQGMVNLIRDEDTMRLVVKIESPVQAYTRYLSLVTTYGATDEEESIVLGFDWIDEAVTIGLVIPLWSNVSSELDGDGGFEIKTEHYNYIFKPVSVQTMWTALQWIHRCLATAHRANHFGGGLSHSWISYYENRITSPRECINFWECMDELENRRDICLSYFDKVKTDEELLKGSIRHKLKEILTRFDLEEVTCRQVREALEAEMKMSLQHLKGYVEEQLFSILGQMDSSSKITDTIFLGSEWNASNLEELKENGVGYILNVTKEIDNFFPGTFEYMNIRLHDVEESDLMRHWGKTYRFLHKAKEKGFTALVHCRRGISRSASTVVAFLMKEHDMSLHDAMKLVKSKRSIVQPNAGFWKQLIIYEGILKSSRHRHSSLFRRRSNSDSTNSKRIHKKIRCLKKDKSIDTDHTDSIPERAHTLPRMASTHEVTTPECELVPDPAQEDVTSTDQPADTSPLLAQATEEWCSEEASDGESSDEESTSDSDEETSLTRSNKLRRTHSEPVMKNVGKFSEISLVFRKPRARTVVERDTTSDEDAFGIVTSPTRISQILPNEQRDILWIETRGKNTTESESEEVKQDSNTDAEILCPGTAGELVNEHSETSQDVAQDTVSEKFSLVVPTGRMEASSESEMELTSESSAADDVFTTETEGLPTVGDNKSTDLARDVPETDCGEEKTSVEVVACENIPSLEGIRPRSRSIGEKLEDKLLHKQGKSESSENVKKVEGRGRVKRRERKSKSDLQLSNSGFVKRHTQIIEEQMLYSMLKNSEKTLASSEANFSQNYSQMVDDGVPTPAEKDSEEKSENDSKNSENNSKNSENNSENSENNSKNSENNSKNSENNSKNSENDSKNSENNSKNSENNSKNSENDSKNSENDLENNSENKKDLQSASDELQNIVQKVNEEVKRDVKGQVDVSRLPLVSQKESTDHTHGNDDVCIDQMAWIDLTHHRGDIVKRKSAAFENVTQERSRPQAKNESSYRKHTQCVGTGSPVRARDELDSNECFGSSVENEMSKEGTRQDTEFAQRESCGARLNNDVPRLDLLQLSNEDLSETSSNSIIVEDYRNWECSSVRERTKILENIIAKTGGSFPSPRSRAVEKQKEKCLAVDEKADEEVKTILFPDESVPAQEEFKKECETRRRSSSCPVGKTLTAESMNDDEFLGDEMVKILVDKFEKKNGETETSSNLQTV